MIPLITEHMIQEIIEHIQYVFLFLFALSMVISQNWLYLLLRVKDPLCKEECPGYDIKMYIIVTPQFRKP